MELTKEQELRYHRHLVLQGIGEEGQTKLLQSRVLIVGVGGLGSPVAQYLSAAGVGTLGLVDGDLVSLTNLQRQVIHKTGDVGRPKVDSAEEAIHLLNPDIRVIKHEFYLSETNVAALVRDYDFIVDGTDNFSSKYLVNDACIMEGKPFCMGGIQRFGGQLMTHLPGTACYRCLFPEPPSIRNVETCSMVGVLGSVAGIMGTLQATEAIKYLTGTGELLTDRLLTFDGLTMQFQDIRMGRQPHCALCGEHPTITTLKEYAFQPCSKR